MSEFYCRGCGAPHEPKRISCSYCLSAYQPEAAFDGHSVRLSVLYGWAAVYPQSLEVIAQGNKVSSCGTSHDRSADKIGVW